jgi:hypothetical protein
MFLNLFAALVPSATLFVEPPLLPASSAAASVGVRVERAQVSAENFSDAPRWLVFTSGGFREVRALAPYSNVVWECTEECLWGVELQVADTDGGALHLSLPISLYAALECEGQTLWFGASPSCWIETDQGLQPFFEESSGEPPSALHVPGVRPGSRPGGDLPPPIDNKPLPPF